MKQCPACKTTYTDDSLRFCLADGAALNFFPDDEPTLVSRSGQASTRGDVSPESGPASFPTASSGKGGSKRGIKILLGILLLGFAAVAVFGVAAVVIYYNYCCGPADIATNTQKPKFTPDPEKQRLQQELANLQERLDEQKNTAAKTRASPTDNNDELGSSITATVNSPNDGFLSLRSEPDTEYGERLAKIPHGGEVEIASCETNQVTLDGRTGRWCLVIYEDYAGWVFDAWLDY